MHQFQVFGRHGAMAHQGVEDSQLPPQPPRQHHALVDAIWLRQAWTVCEQQPAPQLATIPEPLPVEGRDNWKAPAEN